MADDRTTIFRKFFINNVALYEDSGWFCDFYINTLFHFDFTGKKFEFVDFIPCNTEAAYSPIGIYEEKLVLAPIMGDGLLVYDNQIGEFRHIAIREYNNSFAKFNCIKMCGQYAFVFPYSYPAIIKLNMNNYSIDYLEQWYIDAKKYATQKWLFRKIHKENEETYYMILYKSSAVMRINVFTGHYEINQLNMPGMELYDAVYDNGIYWAIYENDKTVWILEGEKRTPIDLPEYFINENLTIHQYKNSIYIFGTVSERIIKIDKIDHKVEILKEGAEVGDDNANKEIVETKYNEIDKYGNIIFYDNHKNNVTRISKDRVEYINIELPDSLIEKREAKRVLFSFSTPKIEGEDGIGLNDFIKAIKCH